MILPGSGRIALALLAAVPAVMAYPWRTAPDRWLLGVAVVIVAALFGSWRRLHLTTIVRRRLQLSLARGRVDRGAYPLVEFMEADARATVVLRVIDGGDRALPLDLISSYLDRYGMRCESVRVTSRDGTTGRTTWVGLTMSAAANLAALHARSTAIPLRQSADVTARRLADELRERGWLVSGVDIDVPDLVGPQAKELWRAVVDEPKGYVAAYSIAGNALAESLTRLWSQGFDEVWTAIEFSARGVAAACAIRTAEVPKAVAPLAGLTVRHGTQWQAVRALSPFATMSLDADLFEPDDVPAVRWNANGVVVNT
ncbi:type VII secretion protein EccE [Mycolicibacterium helvum]|uniref:ESX-3 secretion system protein EccE3 n=1 Tax=Mycolicibacterium helvum TaxID=1534349 RepID=A0A7I7TBQ2_9MYCO|nr:type VII secretion protein EccE [Mycolicibacterium helvum]BBY65586.1 ESX-3 secretion system protein EccE3 [Mycolicibacterium helvum]